MPNLFTALENLKKTHPMFTGKQVNLMDPGVSNIYAEAVAAVDYSSTYPGYDTELHHPKDEYALDTIDAMMFSGDPQEEDLQRIEYFCRRWLQRCEEVRNNR